MLPTAVKLNHITFPPIKFVAPEQAMYKDLGSKGTCHLRFSGIRPLRGYPPPS